MQGALLYCEDDHSIFKAEGPPPDWLGGASSAGGDAPAAPPAKGRRLEGQTPPGRTWWRSVTSQTAHVGQASRRHMRSKTDGLEEPMFLLHDSVGPSGAMP